MAASSAPEAQADGEQRRFLLILKVGLGALLLFILIRGTEDYYPLTQWNMFATAGRGAPPPAVTATKTLGIDRSGRVYRLGGIFPGPYGTASGSVLQTAAHTRDAAARLNYRLTLIEQLRRLYPARDIVQIQFWELRWEVHPYDVPPLNYAQPDSARITASFPVAYYDDLVNPPAPPDDAPDLRFGDSLALVGFEAPDGVDARQCEPLYVRSWWRALDAVGADYQITMTLADGSGIGRAQSDAPLADSQTHTWTDGSEALDRRVIAIPCDLPVGDYSLLTGLYPLETVQNLLVFYPDGAAYGGSLAYLTTIHVGEARAWQ